MSVQERVWEQDGDDRRAGQVIVGPWPGIEEILEESEPAVMIDRRELAAAGPASVSASGEAVRGGRTDPDLVWNVVMAGALVLMALCAGVGLWRLFLISGGLAG
ncbi:MAG: hypothetical protein LKI24_06860 [Acidipropionibacterium sp.]|nr:hypothetical protein [Acidipropionibacterium sp.]